MLSKLLLFLIETGNIRLCDLPRKRRERVTRLINRKYAGRTSTDIE